MDDHNMSRDPCAVNTSTCVSMCFNLAASHYIAQGWPLDGLLPGIPLDAAGDVADPMLGKTPGRYLPGRRRWVGLKEWSRGATHVDARADGAAADWPTGQVCVLGREAAGLDIDVDDEDAARRVRALVEEVIEGPTVARTRAGTGRMLLPFLPWLEPIGYWRVEFTLPGVEGSMAVEMLGSGRQWLAAGEHKSGNGYQWEEGVPAYRSLPLIDNDLSQRIRARLLDEIGENGGSLRSRSGPVGGGPRVRTDDLPQRLSHETLEALLDAVPDTPETVGGWDEGVSLLCSMRYALGRAGAVCPSYVEAWADAYPGSTPGWAVDRWRSMSEVEVTEGRLMMWAEQHAPAEIVASMKREIATHAFAIEGDARLGEFEGGSEISGGSEPEPPEMEAADDLPPEERLQQLIDQALDRVAYFEPERAWVFVRERLTYPTQAFNDSALGRQVSAAELAVRLAQRAPDAPRPKPQAAHAILLPEAHARGRVVKARTYAYGDPALVTLNMTGARLPYLNTAMPSMLQPWQGGVSDADVEPFLAHAERLLPEPDEREIVLSWMAWVLQNPKGKIRWSPVLKGPQGMGKDTLFKVLAEGVGFHNFEEVRPDKLGEKFTSFYERRVVLVTEMSNSDRHNVYERIKAAITGSAAGYLWVERKGIDPYPTLDRVAWVILTNHDDAISMAVDDRRFYVAETAVGDPPGREYFDDLYAWLEGSGGEGYRKAVAWLLQRDASAITPNRPPAATEAKIEMTWNNLPVFAKWFAEQLADGSTTWGRRSVLSIGEVQNWMDANSHLAPHKVAQHYHPRMVREALKAAGWSEYPARLDVGSRAKRVRYRVWTSGSCPSDMPREAVVARYIREASSSVGSSPFDVADGPSDTGAGGF